MTTATFRQLLARRARLIGVGLALLIGVGFTTMTMLFGEVIEAGFRNSVGTEYRAIDFVLEANSESFTGETIAAIEATDGVTDVLVGSPLWIEAQAGSRVTSIVAVDVPDPGGLRDGLVLAAGRLPESSGEITLLRSAARELRVDVGDTVSLAGPYDEDTGEA
nr:hypothetical protein [Chloroflexia bacterium]